MDDKELELKIGKEWEVLVKRADDSGWRVVSKDKEKIHTKKKAFEIRNELRKKGREVKLRKADLPEDHVVLLLKRDLSGWREVSKWRRKRFTKPEAYRIAFKLKSKSRQVKIRKRKDQRHENNRLIEKWLSGDLDFDRDTMVRLAKVARDIKTKLHVNYGKRTYAEQAALYAKYGPGRAARPGTSRHETGKAADVVHAKWRWRNLGDIRGARSAMKKHGLCLPVPREAWHTERGVTWRA